MADKEQFHEGSAEHPPQPRASSVRLEEVLMRDAYEKIGRKEYRAATSILKDILDRFGVALEDKQKSVLYSELGTLYFWLGEYDMAERHSEKALAYGDRNDQAHIILGKISVAKFLFAKARGHFSQVSEENPGCHFGLCLVAIKLRDVKSAQTHLANALTHASSDEAEYRVYESYLNLLRGDAKAALKSARELVPKCDKDPQLLLLLAEIFVTAGNYGEAIGVAKSVVLVCPENDGASAILAHAAYADEDFENAHSHASDAVKQNPHNGYAKTVLMKIATRKGDYATAERIGLEILNDSPEYSLGHANLGDVYFNQGRYELADIEYDQTMQLMDSNTKGARLRQARMKFIKSDFSAAARILEDLVEGYHTYYDDAMCDLYLCYEQLGNTEKRDDLIDKMQMRRSFYHRTEKLLQAIREG